MKNEAFVKVIDACVRHCNHCADACLDEPDIQKMVDCIRLDRVCAQVCNSLSAILMTTHTDIDGLVQYCIQICEECAAECEKHEMKHCQDCAKACRECAQHCREYLA